MRDATFVGVSDNDNAEAQSAYEQKVLEAAQNDPELMAALEQAAKDAGGGEAG